MNPGGRQPVRPLNKNEQAGPSEKQQVYGSLVEKPARGLCVRCCVFLCVCFCCLAVAASEEVVFVPFEGQICQSKEEKKTKRKRKHSQLAVSSAKATRFYYFTSLQALE
ncbi:hypothetical protein TESG_08453 [Trichophyton tonsurans CBS 112818]|uniref:Uncharacterized protein n=1 Tax=Trichophyton tonsurans (strain CBS 112818) TaxID=647933 RepID=F2RZB3_TRIT1|nr:hypothetical protein TESG_08453 [Trichophyton tonsurans CBS 112818]